jgi:hypothetical protein
MGLYGIHAQARRPRPRATLAATGSAGRRMLGTWRRGAVGPGTRERIGNVLKVKDVAALAASEDLVLIEFYPTGGLLDR